MLSGATLRASAMTGAAVFRIVVSNDSMKKATATSQGNNRRLADMGRKGFEIGHGVSAMYFKAISTPAIRPRSPNRFERSLKSMEMR